MDDTKLNPETPADDAEADPLEAIYAAVEDDKYDELDDEFDTPPERGPRTCERPGSLTGLVKGRNDAYNGAVKRVEKFRKR